MQCISSLNDTIKSYPCQFNCITPDDNIKEGVCNNCNCDDENIKSYKCAGRHCDLDSECFSGFCQHHYCTVSKTDLSICTKDTTAKCGRCPNEACKRRKECQHFGCLSDKANPLLPKKCSSCECFLDRYSTVINSKMCAGVNCKGNEYCDSGLCLNGICALTKTSIDTCTTDVEAACGKCDKVACDDNQNAQC